MEINKQHMLMLKQMFIFPQSDNRAPLLRATPTHLIELGDIDLVHIWSLHLYFLGSLLQGGTLQGTERET